MTRPELIRLLKAGKNTRKKHMRWGKPGTGTNSVDDLLKDVNDGSVRLMLIDDVLLCFRQSVCIRVYYRKRTGKLVWLYESYRIIGNRRRMRNLPYVRESWKPSEIPAQTAVRCFAEELGIADATIDDFWDCLERDQGKPYESTLFPGLYVVRYSVFVEHEMRKERYRAYGYCTPENGSVVVFTWREEKTLLKSKEVRRQPFRSMPALAAT